MSDDDETRCDHCGELMRRDINGYWVGADDTSECDANEDGHTVDGTERAGTFR